MLCILLAPCCGTFRTTGRLQQSGTIDPTQNDTMKKSAEAAKHGIIKVKQTRSQVAWMACFAVSASETPVNRMMSLFDIFKLKNPILVRRSNFISNWYQSYSFLFYRFGPWAICGSFTTKLFSHLYSEISKSSQGLEAPCTRVVLYVHLDNRVWMYRFLENTNIFCKYFEINSRSNYCMDVWNLLWMTF